MSHYVLKRGRYWEEYESFREGRKVRKRLVRYWGRVAPPGTEARLAQILDTAERKAEEFAEWQKATFGETAAERREREEQERQFQPERFLEQSELPQEVVGGGSAVSAELNESQPDNHEQGESDGEGGGDADEGHTSVG